MVLIVESDPHRPSRTTLSFTIFEEVGDQFFFAGTAELHLVYVHPEVVFVTSIGGVDDAIFAKAHGLNVVEPCAPGRAAPDRMAPIEDASFSDRCERHSAPPL